MPRKFLKRIMPDHVTMREHKHMRRFGEKIMAPEFWHLNRRSVSVAGLLAIWLRVNLPIAVMCVWITNPLTMAPIYFFTYKVGAILLDVPLRTHEFAFSLEWLWQEIGFVWQPLLLGSVICGALAALAGVIIVRLIWRLVVINSWLKRYQRQNSAKRKDK